MAAENRKIDPKTFGDRAFVQKNKRRNHDPNNASSNTVVPSKDIKRSRITKETSVLDLLSSSEDVYKPKSKETEAMYADFLNIIQEQLGWQPDDVIHSAAHEILEILKNDQIKPSKKKKEIGKILNEVSSEKFHHMMSISRVITDFQPDSEHNGGGVDDSVYNDVGISVELDADEQEEEGIYGDLVEDEDEIDDGECGAMVADGRIVCNEDRED